MNIFPLKGTAWLLLTVALVSSQVANAQGFMGGGYGIMGGGGMGMMGRFSNGPVTGNWVGPVLDYGHVTEFLSESDHLGKADLKDQTVRFSGSEVTIDMVAVQPGHHDGTFEVHGLTNPTVVLPVGALVHLNLVNMDYGNDMEHGVIITPAPPPYGYMAMMQTGPGVAGVMPLLPWRSKKNLKSARYAELGSTFVIRESGTYWYVCVTPGHAQKGMYGRLIVE